MASFEDIRAKMDSKYGDSEEEKKKKREEQEGKAISPSAASNFASVHSRMNSKYSPTYSQVDAKFLDAFITDAQSYLASLQSQYDGMGFSNRDSVYEGQHKKVSDLRTRSWNIRQYLNRSKNSMKAEDYSSLMSFLDSFDEAASSTDYLLYKKKNSFAKYKTEDDYIKGATEASGDRQKRYSDNKKRIDEIKAALPWNAKTFLPSSVEKWFLSDEKDALMDELETLEAENRMYERGEGGYISKIVDDHAKVTTNADFAAGSAKRDYTNASKEDLWDYDMAVVNGSEALSNKGYFDEDGNIRDYYGNIVRPANAPIIEDKLGMFLSSGEEGVTEAYNRLSATNGNYTDTWANLMQEGDQGSWRYLTEAELGIYYYYLGESQEKAYKYLSDMKTELNRRQTLDESGQWYDAYDEANLLEKIAMNAATVPAKFVSTAAGFVEDTANTIMGNEINPYSAAHGGMHFSQTVRGATAEELDATEFKIPVIDFTLGDIYQTGMSRIDSALATSVFGGGGTVFLGMGSAEEEAYRLYKQGASAEQITLGSFAAGAAEAIWEYLSYGKLKEIKNVDSPGKWVKSVLVQGWNELTEEAATEVTNIVTNALVMGTQSDLAELYKENEGAAFETFVDLLKQTAHAAFGGFLGGIGAGGVQSSKIYTNTQAQYAKTGRTIKNADGGVDALMALANEVAGVSTGKTKDSLDKQTAAVGKNATNRKVGRLFNTVSTANDLANASANQADISKSLQRKGFSSEKANAIAEAIVANYNGQELTKEQTNLLKSVNNDQAVRDAVSNIAKNEQSTMGQRRQNIRDFTNDVALGMLYKSLGIDHEATKKAIEEEFTPAEEYDVSVDGKAIATKTGETIDIKGVASIREGEMLLDTGDGKTVNAKDISYANGNDALIYEAVANLGDRVNAETANKLISQYKGGDAMVFARGITQAYSYGFWGIDKSELTSKTSMAAELTPQQRNAAYQLGTQYRPVKDRADQGKARASKKPGEQGVYYRDKNGNAIDIRSYMEQSGKTLTPVRKTAIEAMEKLSATMGVRFNVFESWKENGVTYYLNENGVKVKGDPNGFYDTKTGEIYIDLNAGNDHSGIMLFTVAHELTHFLRQWSPEHFTKIANIVFKHSGMKGRVSELAAKQQAKAKANGRDISFDEALEEVVADGMETILQDGKVVEFMAEVKQKDQTTWEKIKEWFKNLAESLNELIAAYSGRTANSTEGQIVAEAKDILSQIEQIYAEGAIAAGENYQAAEVQKNTTEDGGVEETKNSIRRTRNMSLEDQLSSYYKKQFKQSDSFYFGITPSTLSRSGLDADPLAFAQDDFAKSTRIKHKIPRRVLKWLNKNLARPIFSFTAGKQAAIVIDDIDGDGKPVVVAIHGGHNMDRKPVNAIKSIYGIDSVKDWVDTQIKGGSKFRVYDIEKANAMLQTQGYLAAVGAESDGFWDSITEIDPVVKNESAEAMDIEVDTKTESAAPTVLMSERTWKESDYVQEREKAAKEIAQAIGVPVKKAKAYIDSVNSIAKMIAEDRVRLDYFSSPGRSSFVGNVEYGGSFDFSTLCKKRRLLTGTFTAIQKALPNTALTADEILDIRNRMKDKGIEVSCGLCYVEGSRANMGQFAKEFLKLYKQYYPDAWQPNMADVNTPDGIEWVRINHPECYEQYEYFWNHYGTLKEGDKNLFASQQKPKLYQLHTEYKGEILDKFNDDENVEEKNLNGGIRLQSFSDFEIVHLIDTMQIIMDMSRVGLAGQAYTKVPDFAWALGDTGLKINLSLIAKGVDENGKLIFDDVEGMPIDTAVELRNRYSKNVGTILVAFNDEQLLAAMADERVDFIIPFHRSQWKKSQYEAMGLPAKTKDYTYMQNEKFIKPQYHEYRGRMVKDKATNYMPNEYWDFSKSGKENAEAYLEMCARNNKRPKFYKLLQNNGDGSYSLKADGSTDGYWKLLIDFKMYDNEGNGSPQMPVKPVFNMDEATRMLDEYSGGHSNFPVAQGVVDGFVKEYKDSHKGAMFSDRDNAPTFYSQMAKVVDAVKQDKLGAASVVNMLRGKGVKAEEIKWSGIEEWLDGKKSVTKAELQEFIAGSMLQIEEETLTDKEMPYSQEHLDQIAQYEAERDTIAENLKSEWKRIVGTDIPIANFGAGLESAVVNYLIEANAAKKGETEVGYKYKAAIAALKRCIEYNDDYFGFDNERQAFREAVRNPQDFLDSYELTSFEKGVFRDFIKAKEAYSKVEGIPMQDQKALKAIAESADRFNRRISQVKSEHLAKAAKHRTKWGQYKLKGGENYREVLFKIPGSSYYNEAMAMHWDERDGVLAHARIQDLNTFLGKMLFVEEIQSDWHNDGHKDGYAGDEPALRRRVADLRKQLNSLYDEAVNASGSRADEINKKLDSVDAEWTRLESKLRNGRLAPDAPFRDTYHEFVLKRLIREAAENGYDSIGWTTADIQSDRWSNEFAEGYRIEYDQEIPKFMAKYGKKWGTKVGKTVLDNGIEVWSMAITDSMKDSVLTEGQALYQDRDTESVSNRSLLANAFEGIITNPIEKQKIQEYKGNVAMLDAEEKKLRELNAQIKELSFTKGPRDTKKINDLRFDAQQTANRIATLDKMLLRLEAATPLQNILKREKDMVRKRERQKGKEALAEQRAEFEAKQKETIDKWRNTRKTAVAKARETAEKRDARAKLQKLVMDTVKWISYPTKTDVKCPDILKQPYADFLNGIDLSSKRLANGGEATNNDLRLANAMGSLATALDKIMTSQDPTQETDKVLDTGYLDLPANFVQKLRDMTENIKAMMVDGEYVVNTMTAAEVRQLSQMIRTLNHAIKTMSTLYANLRFANIEALGFDTMEFMDALGEIEKTGGMKDFVQWDNALPYYAFKRFGKGGESVFEGLMDAQDKLAFLAKDIFGFQEKAWTGKEANEWSEDTHTITLPNGNDLTLTTADAMSIYCLSRREQGLQHLLGGGTRVMGLQKGSKKAKDSRSVLTIEDISAITSSLTDRQIAVAEAIQEFMSTVCSEWGNEISMKRFLTKEFNEKFYFPIESNDENLPTKDPAAQQSDLFRLLNISATKPLTPGANNEVIIRNIFDVFTGHASDMARLNAYGMALLDYMKWLNYREKLVNEEGQIKVRGVRKSMEQAYGNAAKSYVLNLVKDVNGRPSDGGDPNILMKWMRAAKTASVGSSFRVATLQLTSYPRAALVLSPKNLALGLTKTPQIEKAKKYCGIALWKSFGFYDTNISRSIEDQMKGVKDVKQKLIELSLKGAEWGDAITWGALWNACEYEVAQTIKNKVGSEEFYQEVGKKLREVVYRTQVVDSTLTRSQMMRSKRGMAQEAAAFMSEPTLSANILMDAGFEFNAEKRRTGSAKAAWTKTGPYIGRALAVYAIGQLTAALLEGLWDAWRDDEDEEFWKKYLSAFGENLALDLVPFNKIPIVSDVFEAALAMIGVGFYSSDKMSTTWLTQAVSAVETWKKVLSGESSTTVYNALYKTVRAVSSYYGVSFSGIMREGVALWNNTAGAYDSTLKIRQYELSKGDLGDELYEAIIAGDTRQADSLEAQFDDPDAMHSAVRKALRENDPRIKEAAQAQIHGDPSERVRIAKLIIADGFAQDDVVAAINAEINAMTSSDTGSGTKKAKGYYTAEDFATEVANGDWSSAAAVKTDIINTAKKNGKTQEQAEDSFVSSAKSELGNLYIDGNISEQKLTSALKTYCGMDDNAIYWQIDKWDYAKTNGSSDGYAKYNDFYAAVQTGKNLKAVIKEYTDNGVENKTLASEITSHYKPLYIKMSRSERAAIKGYLLNAYALLGYDRAKKSKDIDKWLED